jgi:hypothetical protein
MFMKNYFIVLGTRGFPAKGRAVKPESRLRENPLSSGQFSQ